MAIKYRSDIFSVEEVRVEVNGKRMRFDRINENDVVVMLALVGGRIVMERVKRVAIGERLLEVPAGHIERGESAAGAAKREFEEETGYRASGARLLFRARMAPGLVNNIHNYFLLTGIGKGGPHRDAGEEMGIVLVSPERALSMVRSGGLTDGKSIMLLLWAAREGLI